MSEGLLFIGRGVRWWLRAIGFGRLPVRRAGFTIIEVLIVLAVTGALFVSAAIMISGRQNQTAFDQSIRQVQSQIQQAINEVQVGYYPNSGTFQCTAGGSGPLLASGTSEQGTNSGCLFLGKALQFKVAGTTPEAFAVYTIAGLQKGGAGGGESATLPEARPVVVSPSTPSHTIAGYPDNTVNVQLQNGLSAVRAWYKVGATETPIGALAFVSSLAQFSQTGAGQVDVIAIDGTALNTSKPALAELLNSDGGNRLASGTVNPSDGVYVCFESGGTNQYGIIKIGGDQRELAVTLTVKTKDTSGTCTYP